MSAVNQDTTQLMVNHLGHSLAILPNVLIHHYRRCDAHIQTFDPAELRNLQRFNCGVIIFVKAMPKLFIAEDECAFCGQFDVIKRFCFRKRRMAD